MACYFNDKKVLPLADFSQTDSFDSRRTANGEKILSPSFALVEKIKGKTVKSTNLIPFPYADGGAGTSVAKNGITYTVNGDGSLTLNGQNNGIGNSVFFLCSNLVLPAGTYIANLNTEISGIGMIGYDGANYINPIKGLTFSNSTKLETLYTQVQKGNTTTFNNVKIYPTLNEGPTAQPYTPYFTGLKNATISGIKSTGANLFDAKNISLASIKVNEDGSEITMPLSSGNGYLATGIKLKTLCPELKSGDVIYLNFDRYFVDGGVAQNINQFIYLRSASQYIRKQQAFTVTNDSLDGDVCFYGNDYTHGETKQVILKDFRIVREENIPFEPYTENTYQLLESYELGEWDSINPIEKTITRGTRTITFNGTENWQLYLNKANPAGAYVYQLDINDKKPSQTNIICDSYTYRWGAYDYGVVGEYCGHSTNNRVYFATNYSSVAAWKAHLAELANAGNPLTVAYELQTPTTETVENLPRGYTAHKDGTETYLAGETDNSKWGAIPEFTINYPKIMKEGTFNE